MSRAAWVATFLGLGLPWNSFTSPQDIAGQTRQAKQAMLSRHYSEAATIYRRMAAEFPSEPGIRFNLALALHSLGNYRESTQTLEMIRDAAGSNPKFWFLLGEGYLKLHEPRKSIEPLAQAERLDPSNLDTRLELASALLESRQFAESEQRFRVLSREHPELPKTWAGLSISQFGLGDVRAAKESIDRLSELPQSGEQHEMLARIHLQAGEREEAIQELRAAEKLTPGDPGIEGSLARALIRSREFSQAAALLRRLVATNPENPDWQFDLGDALLGMSSTEEAIQHLLKSTQISPALLPAQAKLGEALLLTGSFAAAVTHLQLAAPIDTDGSIHFQLATAYRRLQKPDLSAKAMARYQELQSKAHPPQVERSLP